MMKSKTNAAGEKIILLWGGGGEPDFDDENLWHTKAEFDAQIEEMAALHAASADDGFASVSMIGRVYARYNNKPFSQSKPNVPDRYEPVPVTKLEGTADIYARYNSPKASG